ncbi:mitochondrial ribosomal protein L37, putative [Hepatocystis sp. ex Piliocolobus tephrosceles]|nr:mitochondrial ribosomal protein L37, putative [Hepatocystis sp. ex Piliocolobus tephrosceles]
MLHFYNATILNSNKRFLFPLNLRNIVLSKCKHAPKIKPGKKGKDTKSGSPDSSTSTSGSTEQAHIFNIYKTVDKDHEILPDHAYPKWLWKLEKPLKGYGELALMFFYGKNVESATAEDYHRFRRLHNKNLIKLNNMRLKKSKRSTVKPIFWDL